MCMDWLNIGSQLKDLEKLEIDYLHFDILDGNLALDFTMGSSIINSIRKASRLPADFHLMVNNPSKIFSSFDFRFGDQVVIHQECTQNLHRDLIELKKRGVKVGVALNPASPISYLDYVLEDIDLILLMTVNPGYAGQALVPKVIDKIADMGKIIKDLNLDITIGVDGNVNAKSITQMYKNGARFFVGGSSGLFTQNGIEADLKNLRQLIKDEN